MLEAEAREMEALLAALVGQVREFDRYAQVATDTPFSVSLPPRTGVTTYETECVPNPTPPI